MIKYDSIVERKLLEECDNFDAVKIMKTCDLVLLLFVKYGIFIIQKDTKKRIKII